MNPINWIKRYLEYRAMVKLRHDLTLLAAREVLPSATNTVVAADAVAKFVNNIIKDLN